MRFSRFGVVDWFPLLFLTFYHSLLFVLLPFYLLSFGLPSSGILWSSVVLFFLTGLGITAGYHRLYSHKSYKTNVFVESVLLFFGTLAAQHDALSWSYAHRIHHAKTDTESDPYSVKKGFLHAHVLWVFKKSPPKDFSLIPDLASNRLLRFQHDHYVKLYIIGSFVTFLIPGLLFNDLFGSFVFVYLLRTFFMQHMTFFINSLAHMWGSRSHSPRISAADNYLLSILTFGEGYHNYHHTYPSDYRNGRRWYHFDPGKWLVYSLSKVGMAKNLIRLT